MKPLLTMMTLIITLLASPSLLAKPVALQITMKSYRGDGAYMAVYLTDASGKLVQTLALEGRKRKYRKHLRDWKRSNPSMRFDGVTGASIHRNRSRQWVVNIDEQYLDANYFIHIDTSVEDKRDAPSEVVVPFTRQGANHAITGRTYVQSFQYRL